LLRRPSRGRYRADMRWDALFADLEAAAEGEWLRERDAEIAERTRAELARLRLLDRLSAAADRRIGPGPTEVVVQVAGMGTLRGEVARVAADWFVLLTREYEWVVAVDAVLGVRGLPSAARPPGTEGAVSRGLGWAAAWRVLARDRAPVHAVRRDGSTVSGVPGRVGQDYVELSDLDDAAGFGPGGTDLVPHAAIAAVRSPREVGRA
jgi:hypothetical protein